MKLICPNCQQSFDIDGAQYAALLSQVKNKEFDAELSRRLEEKHQQFLAEQKVVTAEAEQKFQRQLGVKDKALTEREHEIALLKEQVNNTAKTTALEMSGTLADKDKEIVRLKELLKSKDETKQYEINEAVVAKEREIQELTAAIEKNKSEKQIAVLAEQNKAQQEIQNKISEINQLQSREKALKDSYELRLSAAKTEYENLKNYKAQLSTKMIGESLEQHCSNEFNRIRMAMYPNAYFEKDNDASGGSKGDFIFRDKVDEQEYISIMFEMKNEADTTSTKHKNEDFFAKLDKDRNEKKCEYAVLVSMLEPESELYNEGIVDVSYRYPKMFVVRPQFFMPLIALLSQASKKSVDYLRELETARNQSIDVTKFEQKIADFCGVFSKNMQQAVKNHNDAIEKIDTMIKGLESIKTMFGKSNNYLERANTHLEEDLTVRQLTYKNPTMKEKFDKAKESLSTE